ncbi:hypothetical protein, partial [Phocaeicola plebeius]|uniref:hypothetical protein n=1 Tax=Phocaeicola plebeius TaxID=310297 RepID=UPI0022E2922A
TLSGINLQTDNYFHTLQTSLSLEENARTFQLKRKYVLVKTQVRLTPNVRAFYFKRKCVFRRHKNELTFE